MRRHIVPMLVGTVWSLVLGFGTTGCCKPEEKQVYGRHDTVTRVTRSATYGYTISYTDGNLQKRLEIDNENSGVVQVREDVGANSPMWVKYHGTETNKKVKYTYVEVHVRDKSNIE